MNKVKDSNQNIAKAVLKIRQDNKLSQEQFAEMVGVTRQAVSRWEMGVSVPNINTLILISEKFDIPVDEMLKSGDVVEKIDNNKTPFKKDRNYSIVFLIIGILGLISIPFWAEWKQKKNMELFKTAYEHSYDYIFEYPLSIILILALMFIGLGIYFISKKKKGRRFDEKND
ncbi:MULTISPECIES: helix-turn-helix domain-containing protein [Lachnospiraceae]|jgi:transcriptional regulator with XRE-family HTH domain|uniref:helix-turn-helix domain-containing protein n=1 Tax=Lachnospiraceae TaxID=186803 RepID=UPI001FA8A12E|nr:MULTISPECIES: helix-turn-helix domain-containing protein [Lachnospiraceae]